MKLSVIIPAYNERHTIGPCLVKVMAALPHVEKEVVIVDDCSRDGTRDWLRAQVDGLNGDNAALELDAQGDMKVVAGNTRFTVRVLYHDTNLGKGGVNKPLKSDNLEAPEAKKVGAKKEYLRGDGGGM